MIPKRLICILSLFLSAFASNAQNSPDSLIQKDYLASIVERLSSDSLKGRFTSTVYADEAAQFIANEFAKAGVSPVAGNDGYFMKVFNSNGNVMGVIPGKSKKDEVVIFSAHYDHVGTKSSPVLKREGSAIDTIYNGANDNASGVSGIIALAKYFAQLKNNERTLMFVAFTGEEMGLRGSSQLVPLLDPDKIIAVLNFDMIGRPINKKSGPYITGDVHSSLREILNKTLAKHDSKKYGTDYFSGDRYIYEKLFIRSDNYPFVAKGIPAHTIMTSSPNDRYYHSVDDEFKTIDFEKMVNVLRATALACQTIISGQQTPSRIRLPLSTY
jgi:putative aminopeptidase FrvX